MKHSEALKEVIETFDIKAADIARSAEIDEGQISKFKSGKVGINISTWESIVEALPQKARAYLYFLLASNDNSPRTVDHGPTYKAS